MANQQSLIGNGNCFLLADIDGFLGSFIYDLLFTKMWHSLYISFVAINLTAHWLWTMQCYINFYILLIGESNSDQAPPIVNL